MDNEKKLMEFKVLDEIQRFESAISRREGNKSGLMIVVTDRTNEAINIASSHGFNVEVFKGPLSEEKKESAEGILIYAQSYGYDQETADEQLPVGLPRQPLVLVFDTAAFGDLNRQSPDALATHRQYATMIVGS